ncbi:glycoside hydrolase family 97 N-terminal domain-containing protein [Stieleria marina]|uniref:glycoside hydrolase family 97 N-terminal domain-containing protein n=1 Tax=Stieleria marina TaxID=1930275 RepID=UPI003AF3E93A
MDFPITHRPSGRKWSLACRVFDDGVALRYLVSANGTQHVDGENSSWKIIKDAKAWYFERTAKKWKLKSYAGEWLTTDARNLHTVSRPRNADRLRTTQSTWLCRDYQGGDVQLQRHATAWSR